MSNANDDMRKMMKASLRGEIRLPRPKTILSKKDIERRKRPSFRALLQEVE